MIVQLKRVLWKPFILFNVVFHLLCHKITGIKILLELSNNISPRGTFLKFRNLQQDHDENYITMKNIKIVMVVNMVVVVIMMMITGTLIINQMVETLFAKGGHIPIPNIWGKTQWKVWPSDPLPAGVQRYSDPNKEIQPLGSGWLSGKMVFVGHHFVKFQISWQKGWQCKNPMFFRRSLTPFCSCSAAERYVTQWL